MYSSSFIDYYRVLGVHRHAEPAVIDAAYRAMSRRYHPDAFGTNEQQRLLNEAYAVLRDPSQRVYYDRVWDAHHAPFDPERVQRVVRAAAPPAPPPRPAKRGLPVVAKIVIFVALAVLAIGTFNTFWSQPSDPSVAQSGPSTSRATATVPPRPTVSPSVTPDPTQELWQQKQDECRDWNNWVERAEAVSAFANSAQATYEALPYTGPREYESFAEKSLVASKRFLLTNPPPAARAFTEASAGYFAAIAAALEIDAAGGDSRGEWEEADRYFQLAGQELEQANNACSGWRIG